MKAANGAARTQMVSDTNSVELVSDTIIGLLWVDDAQRKRLAHGLRAVEDVQLAQGFLHVVLHGERADLEDHADLDVALAVVDPLQDLQLALREEAVLDRFRPGALERPCDEASRPGAVQVRHHEIGEIRLLAGDRDRTARKDEE